MSDIEERIIGHLDMDAFFASVEEREKPYLKGMPVVIGALPAGGNGRGVVSTANYEARKYGVGSAMPISKAWTLCKNGHDKGGKACIFITPRIAQYSAVSKEVFDIVRQYVSVVAQVSIDEAALDLGFCGSFKEAEKLAQKIKREVKKKTALTCSIGIGENRMIAKMASDYQKPDGLTVINPEAVEGFLSPMSIGRIQGVGKVTKEKLLRMGITTVAEAQRHSWQELQRQFGKAGLTLWEKVRGIDERAVAAEKPKNKSIGKHYTFDTDTHDMKYVTSIIKGQVKDIIEHVKEQGFSNFRTVVLTVRFEDFVTRTRSLTLDYPIKTRNELELKAMKLLLPFFEKTENPRNLATRLIGVRVEKLK